MTKCIKTKNQVIFFVLLLGIAGINVFYQLIIPFKINDNINYLELQAKVSKSSNKSFKKDNIIKINTNKLKEFYEVNDEYCNPRTKELSIICLEKLTEFDDKISKIEKESNNKCDQCIRTEENQILTIFHHTFWQLNEIKSETSQFYRRTIFLNIMSYLTTQNLCCTKFIFWKLKEFPEQIEKEIRNTFKYFIDQNNLQISNFDLKELCAHSQSSFKNTYACDPKNDFNLASQRLISLSDFVRFVVLDVYGGIYTDGDVIYLKDMSLLYHKNFAYRWSYTDNYNTAILGINKNLNPKINELYERILKNNADLNTLINEFHPYRLSDLVRSLNRNTIYDYDVLKTYHSFLFDPPWTCFDGVIKRLKSELVCVFDEFNNKKMIEESQFNPKIHPSGGGSFTYHLHLVNCGSNIRNDSYFKYFENYYYSFLKNHLKT